MSMQKSDILADPLVQETVKVFRDAIAEKYQGKEYGPRPEYLEPRIDDEYDGNPVLTILAETDSLDSISAAVMVSEQYRSWVSISDVKGKLNKDVADTLELMESEAMMMSPEALIKSGNPYALKMAIAMVTGITTGEEFEEMKQAGPEGAMMIGQIMGPLTDLADHLSEDGNWKALPPKLLDRYIEGLESLKDLSNSKTQKRVITEIISTLKEEIAKDNAAQMTEPSTPSAQPAPDSPFVQLKDQAKKLKL